MLNIPGDLETFSNFTHGDIPGRYYGLIAELAVCEKKIGRRFPVICGKIR